MGGRVKVALAVVVAVGVGIGFPQRAVADVFGEEANAGRFGDAFKRKSHWIVGVTLDRAAGPTRLGEERHDGEVEPFNQGEEPFDDQLFGFSATWQRAWFGLHGRYATTPQRRFRRQRTNILLGTRFLYKAFGRTWSYGINAQAEADLENHNWFLYATPLEIGGDLYTNRSFHLQLYVGVRYALVGDVIKNMFIDPNGIQSEDFETIVDNTLDEPWEGYVSLVFARRID